jgi:hypothetical protein
MENEKSEKSTICECGKINLIKNKIRQFNSMKHQLFVLKKRENELIDFHYREWETEVEPMVLEKNPLNEKN